MLKILKGYMRKHVDRKVTHPKERPRNSSKRQRSYCYCFYDKSFFPDYLRNANRRFKNCKRSLTGVKDSDKEKGTDDTFKSETYLRNPWIEAIRWSGTLAFGWSLAQQFHLYVRRQGLQDYAKFHQFDNSSLHKHLCPHHILKNILLSSVQTQPDNFVGVKSLLSAEKVPAPQNSRPIFGPKTADEALNEATEGVKKVRDETVGELQNRLGLHCMSKQQYRKAVKYFAAGSALQNSSATFNLAQCYELGIGTCQNYEKAAKCYRIASDRGNASATYNLAVFYAHGIGGLTTDRRKALQLLENAVAMGEPNAKQLLERYILDKTRASAKKENELKTVVEDKSDKEDTWITEVRSTFAALKLPFIQNNPLTVISNKIERRTKTSSVSTDDGLASEYESSGSSVGSCSSSSGRTCSTLSCRSRSSGNIDRKGETAERSSSGESSLSSHSGHSNLKNFTSKSTESTYGYLSPLLIKNYQLPKTKVKNT